MDWFEYINQIYSTANVSISTHERIIVVEKDYLQNLFAILDKKPTRVVGDNRQINEFYESAIFFVSFLKILANYIMWRLVRLLSPETNSKMNSLAMSFSKALYGNPQSETRYSNLHNV